MALTTCEVCEAFIDTRDDEFTTNKKNEIVCLECDIQDDSTVDHNYWDDGFDNMTHLERQQADETFNKIINKEF